MVRLMSLSRSSIAPTMHYEGAVSFDVYDADLAAFGIFFHNYEGLLPVVGFGISSLSDIHEVSAFIAPDDAVDLTARGL